MDFLSKNLTEYIHSHTNNEDPLLMELSRETHAKVLNPRMLSGHLQGQFLELFSTLFKPKKALEIGTYTGYSAICIARGLEKNGILYTIEIDEELKDFAKRYFKKANLADFIIQFIGNAIDIVPTLSEKFDLIFIDADKENYSNYYDLVFNKLNVGGYIIADNVLWSGKVIEEVNTSDKETLGILNFNNKIHKDQRVENILLPIRDGLMICKKIHA